MRPAVDELVVGPRRSGRRARVVLVGAAALVGAFLVTGSQGVGCGAPTPTSGSALPDRPWLGADDPLVRGLHFAALDRARTRADVAPADVLSPDVRRTTRRLGDTGGVAVYLADGPGFSCLGVDPRPVHGAVTKECLLDATVVNQGLYALVGPDDPFGGPVRAGGPDGTADQVLVVAVPDHAHLLAGPAAERVADYPSVAVLRPHGQAVQLQLGDQAPVTVYGAADDASFPASC